MREIKFRAWYADKKMCEVNEISKLPTKTVWEDGSVLMQYIGLNDKNGKDIYEGDIVRLICYGKNDKRKTQQVIFKNLKFQSELDIPLIDCVIIGNIYQNPELLECKK